jgi:prepilin-type N-terminal cleavage/methylation domain-containing protein/prepilin-type processing-associated H-X9-DG protein
MRRKRGFTLIELLVVIAIIAILAAMLFPVFARARESARKIQCLANVKNISTAIQMYLTDYEKMMPYEHRQDVLDFYSCAADWGTNSWMERSTRSNPYMRDQCILEDYTRNRDIWRCPSAKLMPTGWSINGHINGQDWFVRLNDFTGGNKSAGCPWAACNPPFPPGWGGNITDGMAQGWPCRRSDMSAGAFEYNYNTLYANREMKTSQITDPARWLVVTEVGGSDAMAWQSVCVAYPDICKLGCATTDPACSGMMASWENCSWTTECGAGDPKLGSDVTYRKEFITTRHLGGVNLGFADGHAAWMASEAVMIGMPDWRWFIPEEQRNQNPAIVGPIGVCRMMDL